MVGREHLIVGNRVESVGSVHPLISGLADRLNRVESRLRCR